MKFAKRIRNAIDAREYRLIGIYSSGQGDFVARGVRDETRLLIRLPDGRLGLRDAFDSGVVRSPDKSVVEEAAYEWNESQAILADEFLETVPFREVVQSFVDAAVCARGALIDREDPRDP